ncbi:MAG: RsmE family RNA methyltransferase [Candidatus Wallbacteria bacterium]|nr:RsmE family RNA methyltransferase [Candidatus Wallbacteria bacterium]
MIRLFLEPVLSGSDVIEFSEEFHHLKNVLRVQPQDRIEIIDNAGNYYLASVMEFDPSLKIVRCILIKRSKITDQSGVTMGISLVKRDFESVIDNLTQLNVDRIIPFISERTIIRPVAGKNQKLRERWLGIAKEAAKQCRGKKIPSISEPILFTELVKSAADQKLIFSLEANSRCLAEMEIRHSEILALVGPEGDFTCGEMELAGANGFIPVRLSGNILRTSNAATVIAALLLQRKGSLR